MPQKRPGLSLLSSRETHSPSTCYSLFKSYLKRLCVAVIVPLCVSSSDKGKVISREQLYNPQISRSMCASGVIHRPLLSVLQDCPVSCVRRSVILIGNILKPLLLEIKVLRLSYHLICKPSELGMSSILNLQM